MSSPLTSGPDWYLMRGSGVVSLLLLTAVLALGIATVGRARLGTLPRFVTLALHRSLSLLAVVFVAIHVVTAIVDPYASIRLVDVVLPFAVARYPIGAGLGALSLDVVAALVVTSLLRTRIRPRLWRAVHWLAYAAWPLAFLHGIVIGTDRAAPWMLGVDLLCAGVVAAAVGVRVLRPAGSGLVTA